MRKLGFFSGFTIPKYCLDVANEISAAFAECGRSAPHINKLSLHSVERTYFTEFCTQSWKLEMTAHVAALLYLSVVEDMDRLPTDATARAWTDEKYRYRVAVAADRIVQSTPSFEDEFNMNKMPTDSGEYVFFATFCKRCREMEFSLQEVASTYLTLVPLCAGMPTPQTAQFAKSGALMLQTPGGPIVLGLHEALSQVKRRG